VKHCISCHQDGHTYLECESIPFGQLMAKAMGVPDIMGTIPASQLIENIEKAKRYQQFLKLKNEFESDGRQV
jgi:hypothetical protein